MKLLYKPFAIAAALIGAKLGQRVFTSLWSAIDDAPPPSPTTADASLTRVVGAKALEGATMAAIAAVVDRAGAKSFRYLTGIWPGEDSAESTE
ncbi:MAG: DUF4235 domain-containing protein [Solirubrobacteraceae bacterium]